MAVPLSCAWAIGAELGEGPVWVEREQALWFTDIKRRKLHRFDPATGAMASVDAPDQPGFILPSANGGFVVGLPGGLHRFDPASGDFSLLARIEPDRPGNRLNDAVVDPSGHLWFGTMDDGETSATGRFYRLDDDGIARPRGPHCAITNGPAFSPDGKTLYLVDTLGRTVTACAVDAAGQIGATRTLITIEPDAGFPDGPTVDSAGCLWIGLYDGWAARRYAPDGQLMASIGFPVANITKLAFGGSDLRTVFATTAAQKLDARQLAAQPLAGGLFMFRADTAGVRGVEISHGITD